VNKKLHAPDKPNAKYPHVYAIVRFDRSTEPSNPENCATVVKVLPSRDLAELEAQALREVNKEKDCTYVVQTTRFVGASVTN
jgi:predicted Ser/Thr protein kinase